MLININKLLFVIKDGIDDKEIYSTKIVDELPIDFNDYHWQYINGKLIKKEHVYVKALEDYKKEKITELEKYIAGLQEEGTVIDGKTFKCDTEAKNNLTQCMVGIDFMLPLTWFTRNGEQGMVIFETKEQFMQFALQLASKLAELQNKYYAFKYQIEQCTTKEELDAIVFEMPVEETDPITEEVPAE